MPARIRQPYPLAPGFLAACVLALWFGSPCAWALWAGEPSPQRYHFEQVHMGVPIEIALYATDESTANLAAREAYDRIAELDRILSDYKPESELSRLSDTAGSGKAIPVGTDLWLVLDRAQQLAIDSQGAFDVTVGPFVKLWRRSRRQKELPSADLLAHAREAVGYRHLRLNADRHTATLEKPGMRLDLGGIAMGYAADEALATLSKRGITRVLIDASGDIALGDPPPGEKGWRIGVAPLAEGKPSRFVSLVNQAVTTSGDAWQHVDIDGKHYSHIVDPRTGLGLTDHSGVTVIASDCTTADSLATAVSVLGPQRGIELVEQIAGAAALIVREEQGELKTYKSRRFTDFEVSPN